LKDLGRRLEHGDLPKKKPLTRRGFGAPGADTGASVISSVYQVPRLLP
jgi:hypothetical protein